MSAPTAQSVASNSEHPGNQVYQEEEVMYGSDEEIVEEITDDEDEEVDDNGSVQQPANPPAQSTAPAASASVPAPTTAPVTTPAKARPSEAVKNMKMGSPGEGTTLSSLPSHLNPMINFKNWNQKAFSELSINFPILTTKQETTNELTREKNPENRYWSGLIEFAGNGHTSKTIIINNVTIPFSDNKNYATNFVYMALPGYMADKFGEDGKRRRPTVVNEASLMPDPARWWKAVNKINDKFGVAIEKTKSFRVIPLAPIFDKTQKGIVCNVELQFYAKASTMDRKPLTASDPQRVTVELVRAYILQTGVDVQPPVRAPRATKYAVPSKTGSDNFASDDLLASLAQLGM